MEIILVSVLRAVTSKVTFGFKCEDYGVNYKIGVGRSHQGLE